MSADDIFGGAEDNDDNVADDPDNTRNESVGNHSTNLDDDDSEADDDDFGDDVDVDDEDDDDDDDDGGADDAADGDAAGGDDDAKKKRKRPAKPSAPRGKQSKQLQRKAKRAEFADDEAEEAGDEDDAAPTKKGWCRRERCARGFSHPRTTRAFSRNTHRPQAFQTTSWRCRAGAWAVILCQLTLCESSLQYLDVEAGEDRGGGDEDEGDDDGVDGLIAKDKGELEEVGAVAEARIKARQLESNALQDKPLEDIARRFDEMYQNFDDDDEEQQFNDEFVGSIEATSDVGRQGLLPTVSAMTTTVLCLCVSHIR
jgi:hypothetical protein